MQGALLPEQTLTRLNLLIEAVNDLDRLECAVPFCSRARSTGTWRVLLPEVREGFGEVLDDVQGWLWHVVNKGE